MTTGEIRARNIKRDIRRGKIFKAQMVILRILLYVIVITGALVFLSPFFWMVSTSLKVSEQVFDYPPKWIPNPIVWENYVEGWTEYYNFNLFFWNTVKMTGGAVLGVIVSAPLVAFSFARLRWPGRDVFFMMLLGTMMLPYQVTMIPQFILFKYFGWINTYLPFIIPAFFGGGAFFVFLLRQLIMTVPIELDDAARIDGCSNFMIYLRVILPLIKPGVAAVAIFSFLWNWNNFIGPLIYLNRSAKFTLSLGLMIFRSQGGVYWNMLMAVSLVVMMPCLIVFFFAQRYFIQGIVITGLKG